MKPGANLIYHIKVTEPYETSEMRIVSFSGSEHVRPRYGLTVEESYYGRASIGLSVEGARRLYKCLEKEFNEYS